VCSGCREQTVYVDNFPTPPIIQQRKVKIKPKTKGVLKKRNECAIILAGIRPSVLPSPPAPRPCKGEGKNQCIIRVLPSPLFGKIVGAGLAPAQMELSEIGMIAYKQWIEIPKRFDNIELDEFFIMPHHIHGIIVIYNPEPSFGQPQGLPLRKTLGEIFGAYKSVAAAECLKIYKNDNIMMGKF